MKLPATLFLIAAASLLGIAFLSAEEAKEPQNSRTGPFILGADISWIPEDESAGAKYYDHGVKKDIFEILKTYKFNYVRLRVFVDPGRPGGYAGRRGEPFCDLAHVIALAKRTKAAGMKLLLDIHYGDTWTSPGHQEKPAAWKDLAFPELTAAVHDFTYKTVLEMRNNGVTPDMLQIGNEISDGLLFPDGSRSNWDNFATLLKAGVSGTKEADPTVKIALHHHLGRSNEQMRKWLDNLIQRGVNFDIIGMSCYAQEKEGDWQRNFADLAKRYPDKGLVVFEYSARKRDINDIMFNAPDKKGLGTFIWEPTRHREALFDKDGKNAGGGQQTNFTSDLGTNQGAQLDRPKPPAPTEGAATPPDPADRAARAAARQRRNGGRYDVNALFDLYPIMSHDYGNP